MSYVNLFVNHYICTDLSIVIKVKHVVTVAEFSFIILNKFSKWPPSVSLHFQAGIWMCISITSTMVNGSVFVVRNTGHPDFHNSTSSILIYVETWGISCIITKSVSFVIINHNQERPLKTLLDVWHQKWSTSGPTSWWWWRWWRWW